MGQQDIWAPVLYVTLLIGSLLLFSHFYRKRLASQNAYQSWYPSHPERDLYISLLQKTDPPPPDALLKAALLRRAAVDVSRIIRIREDKPALQALMQKGTIGDDLWASCLMAEKELEAELHEVVAEANTFHQGWGQFIFASAGEIFGHEKTKEVLATIGKKLEEAELRYGKPSRPATATAPTDLTPSKLHVPAVNGNISDSESVASTVGSPGGSKKSNKKKKNRK